MIFDQENQLLLEISDNGIGTASEEASTEGTSFGMRLINLLLMQLDGSMEVDTSEGRRTNMTFKAF